MLYYVFSYCIMFFRFMMHSFVLSLSTPSIFTSFCGLFSIKTTFQELLGCCFENMHNEHCLDIPNER